MLPVTLLLKLLYCTGIVCMLYLLDVPVLTRLLRHVVNGMKHGTFPG